jgi:hypothetical protein
MVKKAAGATKQHQGKNNSRPSAGWRSGNEFRSGSYWVLTSDASDASPNRGDASHSLASPNLGATKRWRA